MWFNVVIRSNTDNREVTRFDISSLEQARNISWTLMQAPNWASCYIVCYNATGGVEFAGAPPGIRMQFPVQDAAPDTVSNAADYEEAESSGYYAYQMEPAAPSK